MASGAERWLERGYILLQYRRPVTLFGAATTFMSNIYHQDQRSNIELFRTVDTTFELGFRLSFQSTRFARIMQ